jgi:hypothetical protein
MPNLDLTSIYTTIGSVLGTPWRLCFGQTKILRINLKEDSPMPYDRQIPDAPIALSMLPRLTDLQDTDLIYVVRPTNPIGQRCSA